MEAIGAKLLLERDDALMCDDTFIKWHDTIRQYVRCSINIAYDNWLKLSNH